MRDPGERTTKLQSSTGPKKASAAPSENPISSPFTDRATLPWSSATNYEELEIMRCLFVLAMSVFVALFLPASVGDLSERASQIQGPGYLNGADASFKTSDSTAKCGNRARMSLKAGATLRCAESSEAATRFVPWRVRNETDVVANVDSETTLMAIADNWHQEILLRFLKVEVRRDFRGCEGTAARCKPAEHGNVAIMGVTGQTGMRMNACDRNEQTAPIADLPTGYAEIAAVPPITEAEISLSAPYG
jgi:hypothetical protein